MIKKTYPRLRPALRPTLKKVAPVFILLFVLAQAVISFAGLSDSHWTPLDRAQVADEIKTVSCAKYPNADLVNVAQRRWVKYEKNGTYVQWDEYYTKILTQKGKRNLETVSSYFTIPYNKTRFTLCEVIKKDGATIPVDVDKNSRVMIESSQMESNIYNPDSKILQVGIPELDLGDTVHCIIYDDFVKVRMPDTWSDYVGFEGVNPIKRFEYIVVAPEEKPLESIALKSEIAGTVTHSRYHDKGLIVYKWTARDVPRMFFEPQMPALHAYIQRLLVSTIKDWKEVSRWYWFLSNRTSKRLLQR